VVAERADEKHIEDSRYFIGKEHELLMSVNILGSVSKPGQYMVPSETDLISLIAYAGGFREDAKINEIKIVRRVGDRGKPNVMKIDLEKFYIAGDQQLTPPLKPDDVVMIANRKSMTAKTIADIVRTVSYVAQVIYIYVLIERK
jgi:protein involved in polysaccharide export with SLBB domain